MKKFLSFVLAFAMLFSVLPVMHVAAAETEQLIIEGENMTKVSGPGATQNMSNKFAYAGFSGGYQYWSQTNPEEGYAMEMSFNLTKDFKGAIDIAHCKAGDFGIFDIYLDNQLLLEDLDMYYAAGEVGQGVARGIADLTDEIELAAGTHTLKVQQVGKNAASEGIVGSVDCLILDGVFTEHIDWSQVTKVIEAEEMTLVQGKVDVQAMPAEQGKVFKAGDFSGDKALWYNVNEENSVWELTFETDYAYQGAMTMPCTVAADFGKFDVYLDDVLVYDDLDMYNAELARKEFKVEEVTLQPGTHSLKLVNVGKNEASTKYFAGLDCLIFDTYVAYRSDTVIIEGELMTVKTGADAMQVMRKHGDDLFSANYHRWTTTNVTEGHIWELAFDLEYPYQGLASIAYCKAADFGKFDVYLDDQLILKDLDMYNADLIHSGLVQMGEVDLAAGEHVLKLVNVGKNEAAVAKYIGSVDCLVLGPIDYTYSYVDAVNMIDDLEAIALLPKAGEAGAAATSYHRVSKYDAATDTYIQWGDKEPGATQGVGWKNNADSNGNLGPADDGKGGIIAADIKGSGMIVRSWFATPQSGLIEIYIDGAAEPAISMPVIDFVSPVGRYEGLDNLVYQTDARGYDNYTPITFNESCKIILRDGWGKYYHFSYRLFAEGETVEPIGQTFTRKQKDALEALNARMGNCAAAPAAVEGENVSKTESVKLPAGAATTIFETDGQAAIKQFKVKFNNELSEPEKMIAMQMLEISMYWDGKKDPAVWTPFGDFFANSGGQVYQSVPSGMTEDGTFYSYWYMPYASGAKIVIENLDEIEHDISVEVVTAPLSGDIADYGRFHAKWSQNVEAGRGSDYTILKKTTGRGRFVGTNLHILNIAPTYWWGEGDEKFFVDGEKFPSTYGTGSEDYFGYAWCRAEYFNEALHAQNWTPGSIGDKGDYNNVRFHIADNIPFQTSFEAAMEKFHTDDITQYSFTAYWYLDAEGVDPYEPVKYTGEEADYRYLSLEIAKEEIETRRNTNVVEGEWMEIVSATGVATNSGIQNMDKEWPSAGKFSNGKQVWSGHSGGVKEDAQMTLSFSLEEAFSGPIQGAFCTAADYGKIQLYLDGVALGEPVDCYATEVLHSGLKTLGEVTLEAGAHELQIKVVGKNDASKGYLFGLDCLVFGEHVLTRKAATEATCISVGYPDHWACADCDKVFEDKYGTTEIAGELVIPVDPDNHVAETELVDAAEATHYENGYTGDTICTDCEEVLIPGEVIPAEHIAKGTATVVAPTCTADGYTLHECDECIVGSVDNIVPALGHDYKKVVTEPTHNTMGYTTYTCEACGESYIDDFTDALEHKYEQEVTTKATCVAEGVMTFTCECGESYTMTLPKAEHACAATVVAPTETAFGYTEHKCANCDYSYISDIVQPVSKPADPEDEKPEDKPAEPTTPSEPEKPEDKPTEPTTPSEPEKAENPFVDIKEDMFCYDAVLWAYENEITTGKDATHFNPSGDCTRAQVVTFLWRAAGEPEPKDAKVSFPDVAADKYYTKAVAWAVENGITAGYKDGTFGPNDTCTRGQIVTFLWRYADEAEAKDAKTFPDVVSGKFYADAVAWAVEEGITSGYKDGTFGPDKTCTRDQIVTFLYRYLVK